MDVKFLTFVDKSGAKTRRFQYTAIDDAKRICALKIYECHNQANAINFVDHVIATFPFRIQEIRTDNGHEFQAKFHWHVEDKGIRHAYIKPSSPQLNGKVERSHRSDEKEFYQLSAIRAMSTLSPNWPSGSNSTTSPDHTALTMGKRLTRHSEKSYNDMKWCLARSPTLQVHPSCKAAPQPPPPAVVTVTTSPAASARPLTIV
jgi:transposase InsO family protein